MRRALGAPSLWLPPLVVILALSGSIGVGAQTENSRSFQMALFHYEEQAGGVNWEATKGLVDVPMFGSETLGGQPPGRSIMRFDYWYKDDHYNGDFPAMSVDWSRILGVVIDEPYTNGLLEVYGDHRDPPFHPCYPFGSYDQTRVANLHELRTKLLRAVQAVHLAAPRTRVWVNFHQKEVDWMRLPLCPEPLNLNDAAIDVVSLDRYELDFSELEDEYEYFITSMPNQQLALVAGTHFRQGVESPQQAAAHLQGFFDYANDKNEQCDIGLGRVGHTGNYDGCRVWIIAGWLAHDIPNHVGLLSVFAYPIRSAWLAQFSKGQRHGALFDDELSVITQLLVY